MLKNVLKGIVIGIANIIPGVSGGTMAISMGIYDKLIHCVTHLFSEFKKSVLFIIPILIGAAIALVGLSFGIEYCMKAFPLQTSLLFIGLIVGGLPTICHQVKGEKRSVGHIIACVIFFVLVVGMAALGEKEGTTADLSLGMASMFKLFGVGIIASATMVIPGVSGSMILLLMGYYNPILETITGFVKALIAFDMPGILHGFAILVPFGLGVVLGIFAIAKLIEIIFEKCAQYAYWSIIGLIVASPFAILLVGGITSISIVSVLVGIVMFVIGFIVAMKLGE